VTINKTAAPGEDTVGLGSLNGSHAKSDNPKVVAYPVFAVELRVSGFTT
jgi:hypothetical protein